MHGNCTPISSGTHPIRPMEVSRFEATLVCYCHLTKVILTKTILKVFFDYVQEYLQEKQAKQLIIILTKIESMQAIS